MGWQNSGTYRIVDKKIAIRVGFFHRYVNDAGAKVPQVNANVLQRQLSIFNPDSFDSLRGFVFWGKIVLSFVMEG